MSSRGRRGYRRPLGGVWRGGGRGSPDSADRAQVGGNPPSARGGGRGVGGTDFSRGGPARGGGHSSVSDIVPGSHGQQVVVDERIADDLDKISDTSSQDAQEAYQGPTKKNLPLRPDFGVDGRHITLHTNFFPIRMPQGPLYEYHVSMVPVGVTRGIQRRVLHLAEQTATWREAGMRGNVAHDGQARLVSVVQLSQPLTIVVPYYAEGETSPPEQGGKMYTVSISFIQQINMADLTSYLAGESHFRDYNALPVLATLNTILTSISRKVDVMIWVHRYFSATTAEPTRLGGTLEAWRGFRPKLKPVYKQLMVGVGISTSVFRTPGNLARAMVDFNQISFGARMGGFCRGVRIRTTHLGHRKVVKRIVPHTARGCSFDTVEGRITVEDYFRQKYNIRLRYPDMPLVDVGIRNPVYLPAEVCEILPEQLFRGKLTSEHATVMTTIARQPTEANRTAIVNLVRNQLGPDQTRPELRSFGMTIGQDMVVVPGRILPKPGIEYLSGAALVDDRASWNLKGVKFAVGARLENWAVLVIKDGSRDEFVGPEDVQLRGVVARFCDVCNVSGMHVIGDPKYAMAQLPHRNLSDPLGRTAIDAIRNALLNVNPKPTLFLVMLASAEKAIYEGLKHLCDVSLDVATVCVRSSKFRSSNLQYLANVALKVNMKLGGINHKLSPDSKAWLNQAPTMIVGIHVSHPGPGSIEGTPSVAAVVTNIDDSFVQYPAKLEMQQGRMEMVMNLKSMMVDRLKLYQEKNNGKLPERIIIYRSVSEGFSCHISSIELPQMLDAFYAFRSGIPYRPKITIVVCSKRHQVRFYPTDVKSTGSGGNPIPGTVVDRGVTAIYNFDFFLQSHDALSGTARPIHYYVIHDEIGFRADELQGVTNSLSYLFARATKSVRLVSPAYYAKIASLRGRCYLRGLELGHLELTAASDSEARPSDEDVMQEALRLWNGGVSRAALKNTMFYL